jgi:hypothetical protein
MRTVNLAGTNIDLLFPTIEYFLEKIRNNEPFHYIRSNHGMWDRHYEVYIANNMGSQYTLDDLDKLCKEKNHKQVANQLRNHVHYGYFIGPKETLEEKLESFQKLFIEYKELSDKLMCGVSVGVGLDELWGRLPRENPIQIGRAKIVELFQKNTNGKYYHTGLLKHWGVTGEIYKLFELLNDLEFQVIFLGPKYFQYSERIFKINDFKFIQIPRRSAIDGFEDNVNQILEWGSSKKTILFHATGHEGAAYFAEKLLNTDIFGFDIGRNIDNIYLDNGIDGEDMTDIESCWYRTIGKDKIVNHIEYLNKISKYK